MTWPSVCRSVIAVLVSLSSVHGWCMDAGAAYRTVPGACLPCGTPNYSAIASGAEADRVYADLVTRCGSAPAAQWRDRVRQTGVDFSREALVSLYEVIGTGGTARLSIQGPDRGVLKAAIVWQTPKLPAPPIATASCQSFAIDKSRVRRVDVREGGVLDRRTGSGQVSLDIPK
jgi:hypothetical protein